MAVVIEGITYFSANEVAEQAGVSRTTFWRWRRDGLVPRGRKLRGERNKILLFTSDEIEDVRGYATQVEPVAGPERGQLRLPLK